MRRAGVDAPRTRGHARALPRLFLRAAPRPPPAVRCSPPPAEEAKEAEEEAPAAAEYDAAFGAAQALPGTEAAFDEYG